MKMLKTLQSMAAVLVLCTLLMPIPFAATARAEPGENGRTFYIDFEDGSDENDGLSPENAFRRAPGDPRAGGEAAATEPAPGDRMIFRGGVIYRGRIEVRNSGREDAPIVYDGNSAGEFGEGRAILDGGEPITGRERCTSPDECGGNPHYGNIYRARIPGSEELDLDAQSVALVQDGEMLHPAMYPNPEDPFYDCDTSEFFQAPQQPSRTQLSDERLAGFGAEHLVGAWVYLRTTSNFVDYRPITGWDAETHTVTYEEANRDPVGPYAIANSLHEKVLDGPGQYVFREADDGYIVYVWPLNGADPSGSLMSYTERGTAMDFGRRGVSHVTVRGFKIRHYRRAMDGRGTEGLRIHDNEITRIRGRGSGQAIHFVSVKDHVVSENNIHHCQRTNAVQSRIGEDVVYRGNRVHMVGRSPLRFYDITRGQMIDNVVTDCRGIHSNALTIYVDPRDILVARNRVHRSSRPMTLQGARRIYVINNIFTASGTTIGIWPRRPPHSTTEQCYFLNNYIGDGEDALFVNKRDARDFVIKNNVISGIGGYPLHEDRVRTHNLFIGPQRGLEEGEFYVEDASDVVRDRAGKDFLPLRSGPTIDMGADVSEYYPRDTFPDFDFDVDIDGRPRVYGEAIDIGPYEREYEEGELADRDPIPTGAEAEPPAPIDAYRRVEDAEPIVIRAKDFTDEGGGEVGFINRDVHGRKNFIRYWNVEGHALEYTIEAEAAGEYDMSLRYASALEAPRRIEVDGRVVVEEVTIPETGGWNSFDVFGIETPISLEAGESVLRLTSLGGQGCNLDEIRLRPREAGEEIVVSAGDFSNEKSPGDESVTVFTAPHHGLFRSWDDDGHWLEWEIGDAQAGMYKVMLRYATLHTAPREFRINGDVVEGLERLTLDTTRGWRVPEETILPAPIALQQGRNVLRITNDGGGGLNLDEIRFIPVEER